MDGKQQDVDSREPGSLEPVEMLTMRRNARKLQDKVFLAGGEQGCGGDCSCIKGRNPSSALNQKSGV